MTQSKQQGRSDELLRLGDEIVARALEGGASVAEASVREGEHLSVKVRLGKPELVEEAGSRAVGLRVMVGQQVAVSYTSDLTEAGRARLVEDALELAQLSEPDPFAGGPEPALLSREADWPVLDTYDPEMGTLTADRALELAIRAEKAALDYDPRIINSEGASISRAVGGSALVTSGGFRGYSDGTYVSLVVNPLTEDADGKKRRGYHWAARRFLSELDDEVEVGREAARRTLRKLGAKKIESAEMPVIFDPDAGRAILGLVASCVNGGSIWRKSSYLVDRLGTAVASPLVTIVDDPLINRAPGSRRFDGEGLASRRNVVVAAGQLETYLLDSYAGRKLGMSSTASASRGSSGGVGIGTTNFVLQPGQETHDELLARTPRGLYVTEMMGFGFNAVTGDFSRGASGFLIEDGALGHAVSEVTISLNLDQLLQRIDGVANDLDLRTSVASPSFRVSAMTIAGR
ncbi:MAG: TldD/PmbA family protein [Myxococcales bacterium]|nr:TldD/PmbA family protein [Myxococcales bacterium]MCB9629385.1 TldD/PmbA family protein [Sandaracinaceae bacterium]